MKASFETCLPLLLAHEGGYSNDPRDPGGPTNFGVTIFDYRKYVKRDATAADVRMMAVEDAKLIYRIRYWDAQHCDELPAGVDYAVFDYGVNSGIGRSGKVLRRVLGLSDMTSLIDDYVVSLAGTANTRTLIAEMCAERLRFLQSLRTWRTFGNGWVRRVADVQATALSLAGHGAVSNEPHASDKIRFQQPIGDRT